MKSPDQAAFKTILIITMIIAIVMLPFVAKAESQQLPTFGDLDLDGDGCINADEFARHQAERHGMHKAKDQ